MTKAQIKGLKPVAYKGALRSVESYYKLYNKNKIIVSKTMEDFSRKVGRYLDKEGNLKTNLTARQVANFNKLVTTFKESDYSKVSRLKEISKQAEEKFVENHAGKTIQDARSVRQIMTDANNAKRKIDSDLAIALTDEAEDRTKITNEEFMNIFYEYINRKKSLVPKEAQGYIGGDDTLRQIQELLDIYEGLEADDKKILIKLIKDDKTLAQIKAHFNKTVKELEEKRKTTWTFEKGHLKRVKNLPNKKSSINKAKNSANKKNKLTVTSKKGKRKTNNGILY